MSLKVSHYFVSHCASLTVSLTLVPPSLCLLSPAAPTSSTVPPSPLWPLSHRLTHRVSAATSFKHQILDPRSSMVKQGVVNNSVVYLVPCKVWPLSTRVALAAPGKDKPLKAPAAFRKKVRRRGSPV